MRTLIAAAALGCSLASSGRAAPFSVAAPSDSSGHQTLTLVELNCENLFDTRHDEGKLDEEFLPTSPRRWTRWRYWHKLNSIAQEIVAAAGGDSGTSAEDGGAPARLPDVVALCEVENDTVLRDLTRRSLLRSAHYEYIMTDSPDQRGLDVALLYDPFSFSPICYETIGVPLVRKMRPTRDVLYVKGRTHRGDTLHLFVVHAPSRYGGTRRSRPFRRQVASVLKSCIDSICAEDADARIVMAGDFNDYDNGELLTSLQHVGLTNVTATAHGANGARGTYCYMGVWRSLDHVLVSLSVLSQVDSAYVFDAPFLLEPDREYGGKRPRRTYAGYKWQDGFSDHLPLVVRFRR